MTADLRHKMQEILSYLAKDATRNWHRQEGYSALESNALLALQRAGHISSRFSAEPLLAASITQGRRSYV